MKTKTIALIGGGVALAAGAVYLATRPGFRVVPKGNTKIAQIMPDFAARASAEHLPVAIEIEGDAGRAFVIARALAFEGGEKFRAQIVNAPDTAFGKKALGKVVGLRASDVIGLADLAAGAVELAL